MLRIYFLAILLNLSEADNIFKSNPVNAIGLNDNPGSRLINSSPKLLISIKYLLYLPRLLLVIMISWTSLLILNCLYNAFILSDGHDFNISSVNLELSVTICSRLSINFDISVKLDSHSGKLSTKSLNVINNLYTFEYLIKRLFKLHNLGIIISGSAFSDPVICENISFNILASSADPLGIILLTLTEPCLGILFI